MHESDVSMTSDIRVNSTSDGWPTRISSPDGLIYIECRQPDDKTIDQATWRESLFAAVHLLMTYYSISMDGETAVMALRKELPQTMESEGSIDSIAYTEPNSDAIYTWPKSNIANYRGDKFNPETPNLPFIEWKWSVLPSYRGNYGPVSNVQFDILDAVMVERTEQEEKWFVLLEAYVSESGNDAILQKTAFVSVLKDRSFSVHETSELLENAGGGGPYDLIMRNLVVSARGDIIAMLPNHYNLGNVLIKLDFHNQLFERIRTFKAPNPELIPIARDVDVEVMKYLRRFPEHITQMPGHSFEKIIAEIMKSHGFSDVQLNVRNMYGEIDIIAFEGTKEKRRKGYIIECKRYRRNRRVTLREAHILAMKKIHMSNKGIDRAMLITTSDFTEPTRKLYDSAWGLELKAYDEVVDWLRTYKPQKDIYFI